MICTEINPEGKFSTWDPNILAELKEGEIKVALGQKKMYENEGMVLWSLVLQPHQRIPFTRHSRYYSWTCRAGGMAISRSANGSIGLIRFEEDDTGVVANYAKADEIRDFENIGEQILELKIIEFKQDQFSGHCVETV
jgi:hypothetical protein